ncbi:Polyketide synthase, enoylreductase domain [Phytophthora cactorum]|nr:Polyketide synthase, enoylreductase domain [Phytophthora cactorum]
MLRIVSRFNQPARRAVQTSGKSLAGAHNMQCRCGNCVQHPMGALPSLPVALFSSSRSPLRHPQDADCCCLEKNNAPAVARTGLGVCHTDLHVWLGDWPLTTSCPSLVATKVPATSLHAGPPQHSPQDWDPVGVKWLANSCLGCEDCRKGTSPRALTPICTASLWTQWCVSFSEHVTPIPTELPMHAAAPILCAGVTVYKALKEIEGSCGDFVVIPGAGGGLGHLACQYARAMGYRVIAIDSGDDKRKLVASYGIKDFIDFKEGNVKEKVFEATEGRGAHATVVVASGGEAYKDALSFLRPHGAVVLVGLPKDTYITAEVFGSVLNAHRIIGSTRSSPEAGGCGRREHDVQVEKLENLPDVFERMADGKLAGRIPTRSPRGHDRQKVDCQYPQHAVSLRQLCAAPHGLHLPSLPVPIILSQVAVALRHPQDADCCCLREEQRSPPSTQGLACDPAGRPETRRGACPSRIQRRVPHGPARMARRLAAGQQAAPRWWPRRCRLRRCYCDHTNTRLKIGDPVGVKWLANSCLGCEDCEGHESTCVDADLHGFTVDGSFQQWCVSFSEHVTPIPTDLPMHAAAPILCAGVTVYKALKEIEGSCGDFVVIPGAGGGLGHLACQYARAMGYRVIAIDSGDDKRKLVASYGIKDFIDFKEGNVKEKVFEATEGRGAHATVVVASGGEAYKDALSFLRPHGAVVWWDTYITAEVFGSVLNSHRIIGSYVGNRQDSIEALKLAAAGDVSTTYTIEKLDNLPSVFERMAAGKLAGRIVLDCE